MFCPNCGEKLDNPNQKFCAHCGSEIQVTPSSEAFEGYNATQTPVVKTSSPPPVPATPVYDVKPVKPKGTGSYSRKSLAYALIWPIFFVIAFYLGFIFMIFRSFSYSPYMPRNPFLWIVPFVLHLVSLLFSIVSKVNSSKARIYEDRNGLQQAGSIISVFGIVLNAIFLVIVPIMMAIGIATMGYLYDPFI
ncbi:MAG: zinc ribbon domain-containing protein [Candidatus Lokiarchaeota archaeon]|nr:zinc ribbon domain-containing protein [Candidatus Lokiarchaeota archaeon]